MATLNITVKTSEAVKEVKELDKHLDALKISAIDAAKAVEAVGKKASGLSASITEINHASQAYQRYLDKVQANVKAQADMTASSDKATKSIKEFNIGTEHGASGLMKFTMAITSISASIFVLQGVIGPMIKSVYQLGSEFESTLARVRAVTQATSEESEKLKQAALEAARTSPWTPTKAIEGLKILAQAGLDANESIKALPSVLKLAMVGELDLEKATDSTVSTMNAMGLQVKDLARVTDVFAVVAAKTVSTIKGISESMKYLAPVAGAMGYSLEEATAMVGLLSQAGLKGGIAGRSLVSVLTDSAKAAKYLGIESRNIFDIIKAIKDQRLSDFQVESIFGTSGLKAVLNLKNMGEEYKRVLGLAREASGFMSKSAEAFGATPGAALRRIFTELDVIVIKTFDQYADELTKRYKNISRSLIENEEEIIGFFKRIIDSAVGVITPLSNIAGTFTMLVAAMGKEVAGFETGLGQVATYGLLGRLFFGNWGVAGLIAAIKSVEFAYNEIEGIKAKPGEDWISSYFKAMKEDVAAIIKLLKIQPDLAAGRVERVPRVENPTGTIEGMFRTTLKGIEDWPTWEVQRAIDGDTIKILSAANNYIKESLRMAGIDTAESVNQVTRDKNVGMGILASAFTNALTPEGSEVTLRGLKESGQYRAKHGRMLGIPYIQDPTQKSNNEFFKEMVSIPELLVKHGLANIYEGTEYDVTGEYRRKLEEARKSATDQLIRDYEKAFPEFPLETRESENSARFAEYKEKIYRWMKDWVDRNLRATKDQVANAFSFDAFIDSDQASMVRDLFGGVGMAMGSEQASMDALRIKIDQDPMVKQLQAVKKFRQDLSKEIEMITDIYGAEVAHEWKQNKEREFLSDYKARNKAMLDHYEKRAQAEKEWQKFEDSHWTESLEKQSQYYESGTRLQESFVVNVMGQGYEVMLGSDIQYFEKKRILLEQAVEAWEKAGMDEVEITRRVNILKADAEMERMQKSQGLYERLFKETGDKQYLQQAMDDFVKIAKQKFAGYLDVLKDPVAAQELVNQEIREKLDQLNGIFDKFFDKVRDGYAGMWGDIGGRISGGVGLTSRQERMLGEGSMFDEPAGTTGLTGAVNFSRDEIMMHPEYFFGGTESMEYKWAKKHYDAEKAQKALLAAEEAAKIAEQQAEANRVAAEASARAAEEVARAQQEALEAQQRIWEEWISYLEGILNQASQFESSIKGYMFEGESRSWGISEWTGRYSSLLGTANSQGITADNFDIMLVVFEDMLDALKHIDSLEQEQRNSMRELVDKYEQSTSSIDEFLTSLQTGELAPVQSAEIMSSTYVRLLQAAQADASKIGEFITFIQSDFLPFMKTYAGSVTADYQAIYDLTTGTMLAMKDLYTINKYEISAEDLIDVTGMDSVKNRIDLIVDAISQVGEGSNVSTDFLQDLLTAIIDTGESSKETSWIAGMLSGTLVATLNPFEAAIDSINSMTANTAAMSENVRLKAKEIADIFNALMQSLRASAASASATAPYVAPPATPSTPAAPPPAPARRRTISTGSFTRRPPTRAATGTATPRP